MYTELHPELNAAVRQKLKEARDKDRQSSFQTLWERVRKENPRLFGQLQAKDWEENDKAEEKDRVANARANYAGGGMQAYEHSGTPFQQKQAKIDDARQRVLAKLKEMRERFPDMPFDFIYGKVQVENRKLFDILKDGEDNSNTTPTYEQSKLSLAMLATMTPHNSYTRQWEGTLPKF